MFLQTVSGCGGLLLRQEHSTYAGNPWPVTGEAAQKSLLPTECGNAPFAAQVGAAVVETATGKTDSFANTLNEATETNLFDSSIDAFTSAYYSTVDNSGNIYVVSNNNTTIYKLELNNHITVFSTFIGTVVACAFDTSVPQTLYILHKGGLVETIPITGGSPYYI